MKGGRTSRSPQGGCEWTRIRKCFGTKRATAITSVVAVLIAATTAWAAWTLIANNTVWKGRTGTLQAVTFSASSSVSTTELYPGGSSAVQIEAANPNSSPVTITAATGGVVSAGGGCPAANFTFDLSKLVGVVVPPGSNTINSAPGALTLAANAPNGCQGQTVFIDPISVTYGVGS